MIDKTFRIRFQGEEFILLGTIESGGAIAKLEQIQGFLPSHAMLSPCGKVQRYRQTVGARSDIDVIEEIESPEIKSLAGLADPGWDRAPPSQGDSYESRN